VYYETHIVGEGITASNSAFVVMQTHVDLAGSAAGYSSGGGHKYQLSVYEFGFAAFRDAIEVVNCGFSLGAHVA
jgi:hypothetical protein